MRSFIAVDFSSNLKKEIVDLQSELKRLAVTGRWKYIDNFHLTLKFLDEVSPFKAAGIIDVVEDICGQTGVFRLGVAKPGHFPGRDCIRVLWLGINGELDRLGSLQTRIDEGLENLGFKREKRGYSPHVTIGQEVVFDKSFERIAELLKIKEFSPIEVNSIYLFKSEQIANKRVYTPVHEFKLKGKK